MLYRLPVPDFDHLLAGSELNSHEHRDLDQEADHVRDRINFHTALFHDTDIIGVQQLFARHIQLAMYTGLHPLDAAALLQHLRGLCYVCVTMACCRFRLLAIYQHRSLTSIILISVGSAIAGTSIC